MRNKHKTPHPPQYTKKQVTVQNITLEKKNYFMSKVYLTKKSIILNLSKRQKNKSCKLMQFLKICFFDGEIYPLEPILKGWTDTSLVFIYVIKCSYLFIF